MAVFVQPHAHDALARAARTDTFDRDALIGTAGRPDTPVPALLGLDRAARPAAGPRRLHLPGGSVLRTTLAVTVTTTPALPDPGLPFVVVPAGPAAHRLPELAPP
ncbi:hypothetical protein VM98_38095, partial [Streptomyces rubellomurinus subsp. indigoferus]